MTKLDEYRSRATINPDHYRQGGIETIDVIDAWVDDVDSYCLGNAIKYISRYGKKSAEDPHDDIRKAIWYLQYILNKD